MAEQEILIPYNFTIADEKALTFVINTFSHRNDTKITLFNTYTPLPVMDMSASPEMDKMKNAMAIISRDIEGKEAGLKSAKEHLLENGFSDDQVDFIFKERKQSIAEEIIVCALRGHYAILVLSRQPGKVTRFFARSVHSRVLSTLKDVTVCIAN